MRRYSDWRWNDRITIIWRRGSYRIILQIRAFIIIINLLLLLFHRHIMIFVNFLFLLIQFVFIDLLALFRLLCINHWSTLRNFLGKILMRRIRKHFSYIFSFRIIWQRWFWDIMIIVIIRWKLITIVKMFVISFQNMCKSSHLPISLLLTHILSLIVVLWIMMRIITDWWH